MSKQKWIFLLVALAMMATVAATLNHLRVNQRLGRPAVKTSPIPGSQRLNIYLPENVLQYISTNIPTSEGVLSGLPQDTSFAQRQYVAPSNNIDWLDLMVVLMGTDRTSIHKPQFCLKGMGWDFDDQNVLKDSVPIESPHPYDLPVARLMLSKQSLSEGKSEKMSGIYIYWFVADDQMTGDHYARMWRTATHLLKTGELHRWAYIGCLAVCRPGEEDATLARMKTFIAATVPEFQLVTGPETPRHGVLQTAAN